MQELNQRIKLSYTYHSVWKGDHTETTIAIINPPANEIEKVEWRWGFNGKANEYTITTTEPNLRLSSFVPTKQLSYTFRLKIKG